MKIVAAAQVAAEAAVVVDSAAAQVAAVGDTVGVEIAVTVAAEADTAEAEIAAVTVVVIADVTAATKSFRFGECSVAGCPVR